MNFDVTTIIPTFTRPQRTARAVRSVLAQANLAAEVVVVDDASPQPFVLDADLQDPRVRVVRLNENSGPAVARNAGIEAARADVFAFLDSDDLLFPDSLASRLGEFRSVSERSSPMLFCGPVWRWFPGRQAALYRPAAAAEAETLASGCWYFPGSTAIFARSTWERIGPFDSGLRRLEDLDWGVRLGLAGGMVRVSKTTAAIVTRSPPPTSMVVKPATERLRDRYLRNGNLTAVGRRRLKAYLALEEARAALGEGNLLAFAAKTVETLAANPRLSIHQGRWWEVHHGSGDDLAVVEAWSRLLTR